MTKFSVTKNGVVLDEKLYNWDEGTRIFSTNENGLVLDFTGVHGVIFKTSNNCIFNTGDYCTFKTSNNCIFNTGDNCTFNTGSNCTFNTDYDCTFNTGFDCVFDTGSNCVVVRRDVFEVIEIPENVKIKLNEREVKGYEEVKDTKTIVIDGNEIEISNESYENLKKSLI